MATPGTTLQNPEVDKGFDPMADLPTTENTNSGGFFLDLKEERSINPIVKSGWYNIEITGVDNAPSKKNKKMLTIIMRAENEHSSAEVRAYAGSWSPGLYFGACHLAGIYSGRGIESIASLVGLKGFAFVKVTIDDGQPNTNVTNILTKAEMLAEGHPLPGFFPKGSTTPEPTAFIGSDDDEIFE